MREAHNSKFKIQNSKLRQLAHNSKFKNQNSKIAKLVSACKQAACKAEHKVLRHYRPPTVANAAHYS